MARSPQPRSKAGSNRRSPGPANTRRGVPPPSAGQGRRIGLIAGGVIGLVAVIVLGVAASGMLGSSSSTPAGETAVQASGGRWTDVTADRLAAMLTSKDFTLLNVKTPYIGEIAGTDLYIPYDQLPARASELPASKSARIVVYCRSGNESRIASQTLVDLGYTNIYNLAGGMEAWTSSGRSLVNLNRQS